VGADRRQALAAPELVRPADRRRDHALPDVVLVAPRSATSGELGLVRLGVRVQVTAALDQRFKLVGFEDPALRASRSQPLHGSGGVVREPSALHGVLEDPLERAKELVDRGVGERADRPARRVARDFACLQHRHGDATHPACAVKGEPAAVDPTQALTS
jgi:hypothetical protein